MSEIAHTLDIAEGWYGSQNDEAAFFEWLGKISCVSGYRGCHENGADLVRVDLTTSAPNDADLRDLIALHHRYRRDMTSLAQFRTEQNETWFGDPQKYWFGAVFGSAVVKG